MRLWLLRGRRSVDGPGVVSLGHHPCTK